MGKQKDSRTLGRVLIVLGIFTLPLGIILIILGVRKLKADPDGEKALPSAVPCEQEPDALADTPQPSNSASSNATKVITGKCGSMVVEDTVSHFLFVPVKHRKILSISSDQCPCGHSFGSWNEKVHRGTAQSDRFEKGAHEPIGLLDFDVDRGLAKISGSSGTEYMTDLNWCSCPDFDKRSKPSKHIYFLAIQMGYTSDDFYSC